jgi:non-canonical (house-cleaning) NTP pyrophosphatase
MGNVGRLTLGVLPRAEYARHAVLCALVAFLHPDLYGPDPAREAP